MCPNQNCQFFSFGPTQLIILAPNSYQHISLPAQQVHLSTIRNIFLRILFSGEKETNDPWIGAGTIWYLFTGWLQVNQSNMVF